MNVLTNSRSSTWGHLQYGPQTKRPTCDPEHIRIVLALVVALTNAIVPVIFAGCDILYFGLSFKYGMGGFHKLDLVCVGITMFAVTLWVTTSDPEIALYANLCALGLGFIPVIKKAYTHPGTENTTAWCLGIVASALTVAIVRSWTTAIAALPIVNLVGIGTVAILLIVPREPIVQSPSLLAADPTTTV